MIKIYDKNSIKSGEVFERSTPTNDVSGAVADIIADVIKNGDGALYRLTEKFDKATLSSLAVTDDEIKEAYEATEPEFIRILERAAENIRAFHKNQVRKGSMMNREDGVVMGQRVIPVDRAGIYVPGGTAAYPSTVLMTAIPAKLAGVSQIVMVTPPGKDGKIAPAILAAAKVAGVDNIYKIGGAQAIAALAYGTETVPKVDKIVGPGNAYVAEAKRQVFGRVSIDMIAGPSEILIISDGNSNPEVVAADMLSQAEHDRSASAVLITTSKALAEKVSEQLEIQIPKLERAKIARASIDKNGKIIIADSIKDAADVSNEIAPEHLELCVDDPFELLPYIRHAGSVFMGRYCPEPLGDYMAGPNHTLPTSGTARFSSPLSVDDFVKTMQYSYFTKEALARYKDDVSYFAKKEGLTAHAKSAVIRDEINE
jgi:histidinol dehydrogenase